MIGVSGNIQLHAADARVRQLETEKAWMLDLIRLMSRYLAGEDALFNEVWEKVRQVLLVNGESLAIADDRVSRMLERREILQMLSQLQGMNPYVAQVIEVIRMRGDSPW